MGVLQFYALASLSTLLAALASAWRSVGSSIPMLLAYVMTSKLSLLVLGNFLLCLVIATWRVVQLVFLGPLRALERKKLNERLVNYLLFKLLFVGAMLEHGVGGVTMWISWVALACFLKSFAMLGRDRVEYLLNVNGVEKSRPLVLVVLVFLTSTAIAVSIMLWAPVSVSLGLLLIFDCVNVDIDCLHTFAKVAVFHYDAKQNGDWEERGHYLYMVDVGSESLLLLASLLHYAHLLYLLGISFTLIDVILLLNMRNVFLSLIRKWNNYTTFVAMEEELRLRYPTIEGDEIPADQVCAICRDSMTVAKVLPCGHLYHLRCIRGWLEENQNSCPMCRYDLRKATRADPGPNAIQQEQGEDADANNGGNGGFLEWFLPFFGGGARPIRPEDVDRILEMFPNINREVIVADLQQTGSAELTIENILAGRIAPPIERFPEPAVEEEAVVAIQEVDSVDSAEEIEEIEEIDAPSANNNWNDEWNSADDEEYDENLESDIPSLVPELSASDRRELALSAALKRSQGNDESF